MTISGPAVIDGDGVRPAWMTVLASGVTVDGLTMRNAGPGVAQSGSLNVDGASDFTLRNATLSGGSYADLRLWNGSGHRVEASDLGTGRALGLIAWNITDSTIEDNRLHDNNTAGFDAGYEAGGMKLGQASRVTVGGNEVDENRGVGIWCDVSCADFTVSDNRVHGNTHQGILFEISENATITGNAVWENGWSFTPWGWGGGIVVSSSGGADVTGNTVAWNADGIVVISQDRDGAPAVTDNRVRDNLVALAPQPGDGRDAYALAWLADWASPMFGPDAGNGGAGNLVALVGATADVPFAWAGGELADPGAFAATPGGAGLRILGNDEARTRLASAGVPSDPIPMVVHRVFTRRETVVRGVVAAGIAVRVLVLFLVAVFVRRRRRRGRPAAATPRA